MTIDLDDGSRRSYLDQRRCGQIKPSSLREELLMSLRTIVSIAALVIISITTVSTAFARVPAGTTRLHHHKHHHQHTVHHSGQVRH
jgi:hypothetical protein